MLSHIDSDSAICFYVDRVLMFDLKRNMREVEDASKVQDPVSSRAQIEPQVIGLPNAMLFLLCSSCILSWFLWGLSHPYPTQSLLVRLEVFKIQVQSTEFIILLSAWQLIITGLSKYFLSLCFFPSFLIPCPLPLPHEYPSSSDVLTHMLWLCTLEKLKHYFVYICVSNFHKWHWAMDCVFCFLIQHFLHGLFSCCVYI